MDTICTSVFQSEDNAIIQILKIADMVIGMHKEMNPALLFDLRKYHPETYRYFSEHRENSIQKQLIENLKAGIKQKLYRSDININLTTGFYMSLIEECISSEIGIISNIPFIEKYSFMVRYHLHAICTPKGIQFMEENFALNNKTYQSI
jgi:hypothetical protein